MEGSFPDEANYSGNAQLAEVYGYPSSMHQCKTWPLYALLSSKSYWHLSRTLATQSGMANEWLKRQGLISVRDRWMKAHGYA